MSEIKFRSRHQRLDRTAEVAARFDRDARDALKQICEMPEDDFAKEFGMTTTKVDVSRYKWQDPSEDFYHFVDNGSNILAVAHLDTVGMPHERTAQIIDTEGGPVIFSRALDDRLGAWIILHLLPRLGLKFDILLTVGEESGNSTAQFFEPPEGKEYNWMIEFDRGDKDVVMYQYDDPEMRELVRDAGAIPDMGSFSDIAFLEQLGCKGFNWGVAYREYHYPRAHAFLNDTFEMVGLFLNFHDQNGETHLEHEEFVEPAQSNYEDWWSKTSLWADEIDLDEDWEQRTADRASSLGITFNEAAELDHEADLLADLADAQWPG